MFKERTVFVVGAGASCEAGLPSGEGLIPLIQGYVFEPHSGFRDAIKYVHQYYHDMRDQPALGHAANRIFAGLPASFSIDNFIHQNGGNKAVEIVGKLAIAKTILDAECASSLAVESVTTLGGPFLSKVRGTWYTKLSSLMFEGCTVEKLPERLSQITFVIFNYDRCLEHYLFWALRYTYGLANGEAAGMMRHLTIYHPYGSVGELEHFSHEGVVQFGDNTLDVGDMWRVTKRIKTFTEGVNSEEADGIREAVRLSKTIVFLGFAFHHLNMALMQEPPSPETTRAMSKQIYGTAFGRSGSDIKRLETRAKNLWSSPSRSHATLTDCECWKLFDTYQATFAAGSY